MSPVKSPEKVISPQVAYLVLEASDELPYNPAHHFTEMAEFSIFIGDLAPEANGRNDFLYA